MAEKTFTFREGWKEAIKALPNDVRLEIYEAIVGFAFGDNIEGLKPMAEVVLNFVKPQIEEEFRRKEAIAERNRRNGAKHVAKEKPSTEQDDLVKPETKEENPKEPNETQKNPNNPVAFLASQERKEAKERDIFLSVSEKTDECETCVPACEEDADIDWKRLREQLVLIFKGTRIPKPNSNFSEGRKTHIRARIKEVGMDKFIEVMKKAANSTFLSKKTTFSISLSWLIKPQNFEQILEGAYDDKPSEIESYISEKTKEYQINWESVVKWFNGCGLVPIVTLTDERKYLFLKAYELIEGDKGKKSEALKKFKAEIRESDVLHGKIPNSKKRDFDWCFSREHYLEIIEGSYNNKNYNKTEEFNGTTESKGGSAAPNPENAESYYVTESL